MKKICAMVVCSLVLFVGSTSARCIGPVVNGRCLGTIVSGDDEPQQSYRGVSGNQYQYDLNKRSDYNQYIYDIDAQRRDQMNIDPGIEQEDESRQHGGGIYSR